MSSIEWCSFHQSDSDEPKPTSDRGLNASEHCFATTTPAPHSAPYSSGGGCGRGSNGAHGNGSGRARHLQRPHARQRRQHHVPHLPRYTLHLKGLPFKGGQVWGCGSGHRCTGRWGGVLSAEQRQPRAHVPSVVHSGMRS
jgi:hypothetical protein